MVETLKYAYAQMPFLGDQEIEDVEDVRNLLTFISFFLTRSMKNVAC